MVCLLVSGSWVGGVGEAEADYLPEVPTTTILRLSRHVMIIIDLKSCARKQR